MTIQKRDNQQPNCIQFFRDRLIVLSECTNEPMVDVTITFASDKPLSEKEIIDRLIQMLKDSGFEMEYKDEI